jgi:hypothetical protein
VNDANELSLISLPRMHPAALHLDLRWVWKNKKDGDQSLNRNRGLEVLEVVKVLLWSSIFWHRVEKHTASMFRAEKLVPSYQISRCHNRELQ